MIDIDKLRAAFDATKERSTPDFRELSNDDLRGSKLPITAYEADFHYKEPGDALCKATISEIKIIRFGVAPGCSGESISFVSRGQKYIGTASYYYPTKEDAQAYADMCLEENRCMAARADFHDVAYDAWPSLLDEIVRLRGALEKIKVGSDNNTRRALRLTDWQMHSIASEALSEGDKNDHHPEIHPAR